MAQASEAVLRQPSLGTAVWGPYRCPRLGGKASCAIATHSWRLCSRSSSGSEDSTKENLERGNGRSIALYLASIRCPPIPTIDFPQLFGSQHSLSVCHSGLCSAGQGSGDASASARGRATNSPASLLRIRSRSQASAYNTCQLEYLAGASAITEGSLTGSTPFVLTYSSSVISSGDGQDGPLLPDELCNGAGLFHFTDVPSGCWIDPPMAEGLITK